MFFFLYPKTVHRIISACYSGAAWFVLKPCVASHMRCSAESSGTLWVQLSECRGSCKTALCSCCLHKHASCVPTVGSRTPKGPQLFYSVKHTMLIGGGSGVPRVRISESRVDTVWKELVKQAIICGGRGYGQGADVCRYYKGRETPPKSGFHRKTLKGNFSSLRNTLVELSILGSSSEREQVLVLSMMSLLKNPYFFHLSCILKNV